MSACPIEVFDLTKLQSDPAPHTRLSKGRTLMRDPEDIEGIMIHQTAVNFGVARYQIFAVGGDAGEAQRRRALDVACHTMAFAEGWVVHAHPIASYVNHGNAANAVTLGLEIEGIFAGLEDDPYTVPREDRLTTWGKRDPDVFDRDRIATARVALRSLLERAREAGCKNIRYVYAHRQSSKMRRADPGEAIWRHVVEEYAVPDLKLVADRKRVWGKGRPIPREWSDDSVQARY